MTQPDQDPSVAARSLPPDRTAGPQGFPRVFAPLSHEAAAGPEITAGPAPPTGAPPEPAAGSAVGATRAGATDRPNTKVEDAAGLLVIVVIAAVILSLLLMGVGLVVLWLSEVAGVPLPREPDDPERVDVLALAQLMGYGLGGAVAGIAALWVGWHLAPRRLRPFLSETAGRVAGAGLLGLLAAGGVLTGIEDWNPLAFLAAVGFAYGAVRVALGLPFGDDEDEHD